MLLKNKIALITGAGSGIGRACALAFIREGATVILSDIIGTAVEETGRLVTERGGNGVFVRTDVTKAQDVEALIRIAVESYGRLDCACNNAGIEGVNATTAEYREEDWDQVVNVNLRGIWLCMKSELQVMIKQGGGAIVNMGSIMSLVGVPNRPAYVASKHAVIGLTKAASLEFGGKNIRINAICPGVIRTPLMARILAEGGPEAESQRIARHPIGRLGMPMEVAEAAVWLLSDAASFVTGVAMPVDGGYTVQ